MKIGERVGGEATTEEEEEEEVVVYMTPTGETDIELFDGEIRQQRGRENKLISNVW